MPRRQSAEASKRRASSVKRASSTERRVGGRGTSTAEPSSNERRGRRRGMSTEASSKRKSSSVTGRAKSSERTSSALARQQSERTSKLPKKKAPIRRTKSYESVNTTDAKPDSQEGINITLERGNRKRADAHLEPGQGKGSFSNSGLLAELEHRMGSGGSGGNAAPQKRRESPSRMQKQSNEGTNKVSSSVKKRAKSKDRKKEGGKNSEAVPAQRNSSSACRSKSAERKAGRRESGRTKIPKKKAPIRRTRSYESINTNEAKAGTPEIRCRSAESGPVAGSRLLDERGLPLTSEGCAPVASLVRPISPDNGESFDEMLAQKLQQEEYALNSRRPGLIPRGSSRSLGSTRSLGNFKALAEEDDDRKPPATAQRARSGKTQRQGSQGDIAATRLVPLNPDESRQSQRKSYLSDAKSFVKKLKAVLSHVGCTAGTDLLRSSCPDQSAGPIFSSILTNEEMRDLVAAMLQTQSTFQAQRKPTRVDIGYHFCRGCNLKRIQQQPGLWSKIQSKGISKSQDGEGIITFNKPQACQESDSDDVWMVVARLQGKRSTASSTKRQWRGEVDALVHNDSGAIVLRASAQMLPLVRFRATALADEGRICHNFLKHVQLMQRQLQLLVNEFFGNASDQNTKATSSPDRGGPSRGGQQRIYPTSSTALEVAMEVQAVVEEHSGAAGAVTSGFGNVVFSVQAAVPVEELTVLADNMFRAQNRFRDKSKPVHVDIGYHYCRGQNLLKMKQKPGFWSNIQSRGFNKSEDGDGIYTFNDPLGTRSRGGRSGGFYDMRQSVSKDEDVWLLVARLQGQRQNSAVSTPPGTARSRRKWGDNTDALLIGNRQSDDVVVLRTSTQFFPLLQFPASAVDAMSGVNIDETIQELQMVHQRLQKILDTSFNAYDNDSGPNVIEEEVLEYNAPDSLDMMKSINCANQLIYTIHSHNKKAINDDCAICLDSLRRTSHQQVVKLKNCGHEFHRSCLHDALNHFDLCPICNQEVSPPSPRSCLQGLSPSGIMVATTIAHVFCQGCWAPRGSLVLSFFVPAGIQKAFHGNPGAAYPSSNWKAYLPCNEQGVKLLRRFQYAFLYGLIFSVQSSRHLPSSEGRTVWANIPRKTNPGMGDGCGDGFPDHSYLDRCNQELDRCGVPESALCEHFLRQRHNKKSIMETPQPSNSTSSATTALRTSESVQCSLILKRLQKHKHGWMFCRTLPSDDGTVESPMDFSTIEKKLVLQEYSSLDGFCHDVNLTFDNAMTHHSKENPVHFMAKQLKKKFKKDFKLLLQE